MNWFLQDVQKNMPARGPKQCSPFNVDDDDDDDVVVDDDDDDVGGGDVDDDAEYDDSKWIGLCQLSLTLVTK